MIRRKRAFHLWFLLSFAGCSCEWHAGTSRGTTSSGGERTAADWERERQRQEWERERWERERRERDERERRGGTRVVGSPTRSTSAPKHAPAPPAQPAPMPSNVAPGSMGGPNTPPASPAPVVGGFGAPAAAPAPAAPVPAAPAPTQPSPPAPVPAQPPPPPADPGDNYVPARDPSNRPDSSGQGPGSAGQPVAPSRPKHPTRGSTLSPKR